MAKLILYCLGAFEATLDGVSITAAFDTDKTRALLAYLTLEAGRPHRREHLAALLWSDIATERGLHNLRQTLSLLKKTTAGRSILHHHARHSPIQPAERSLAGRARLHVCA